MNPFSVQNGQNSSRNKQFRCCVAGCKTRSSNGFHNFPTNKTVCLEWMKKTQMYLDVNTISKSFRKVCKLHFKVSDFEISISGKKRLKKGAVPSLFLPDVNVEHNIVQQAVRNQGQTMNLTQGIDEEPLNKKRKDNNGNAFSFATANHVDIGSNNESKEIGQPEASNDLVAAKLIEMEETIKRLTMEKSQIQIELRKSQKKVKLLRQKLKSSKLNDDKVIKYLSLIFNDKQLEFFKMQIKNSGKKNRGQRYTQEQKSLCLCLYKHGPKCYRFMQKIFALPTKRTLQRHNAHLHFEAGIDDDMLKFIKEKVKDLPEIEKYCIVSWDEQSVKPHLDYNHVNDNIDGFVDLGYLRRPTFLTHSLTFMVRGINSGYKQSVAFFYTDDLKSFELAEIIRLVIEAVLDTGLKVIGSVCDQVPSNVSAVGCLINPNRVTPQKQEGQILKYQISETEIIHCYDLPHLIKVIRNNFNTKDLKHCISNRWNISKSKGYYNEKKTYTASWKDIAEIYDFDLKGSQRLLKKITNEHIYPDKLKMKVSIATQVFSQTFGNVMLHFSKQGPYPKDCFGTAQVLLFFNDLFDSLNGSGELQPNTLFGSINESSDHFIYWEYALNMLSNMSFIDRETQKPNNRSSVIYKFMSTIRGYQELTKICLNLNMKQVALRNCNQDGLENLFGVIKSCNHVDKPIATQFKTGYATMIVNNLNSGTSLSSNCEEDFSKPLLNNVHEMLLSYKEKLQTDPKKLKVQSDYSNDIIVYDPEIIKTALSFVEDEAITYISSVVCRKLLEKTNCSPCINNLQSSSNLKAHSIIDKLNSSDQIFYKNPSLTFMKTFKRLFNVSSQIIPDLCSENLLKDKVVSQLENLDVDCVGCSEHKKEITTKMKKFAAYYAIIDFCKNINNLLSGKIKTLPTNADNMQKLALKFKEKSKHKGKYSDKFTDTNSTENKNTEKATVSIEPISSNIESRKILKNKNPPKGKVIKYNFNIFNKKF